MENMNLYDITIKCTRKGQSLHMTRKIKGFPARNLGEALNQISAEWHDTYEGKWDIVIVRAEVVDE